jgi:hypothetical protein
MQRWIISRAFREIGTKKKIVTQKKFREFRKYLWAFRKFSIRESRKGRFRFKGESTLPDFLILVSPGIWKLILKSFYLE